MNGYRTSCSLRIRCGSISVARYKTILHFNRLESVDKRQQPRCILFLVTDESCTFFVRANNQSVSPEEKKVSSVAEYFFTLFAETDRWSFSLFSSISQVLLRFRKNRGARLTRTLNRNVTVPDAIRSCLFADKHHFP